MRRSTASRPTGRRLPKGWRATPRPTSPAIAPRGRSELVERQEESWDALLAWARRRYDVDFATTSGLMHVAQPPATVERLGHAVAALDAFHLAGLSPLVTIGGSLVAALAVLEKAITPEQAWEAVSIDERWQLEQWGADAEAERRSRTGERDFLAAARFLELLDLVSRADQARGRNRRDRSGARASSRSAATIARTCARQASMSRLTSTYSYSAQ